MSEDTHIRLIRAANPVFSRCASCSVDGTSHPHYYGKCWKHKQQRDCSTCEFKDSLNLAQVVMAHVMDENVCL